MATEKSIVHVAVGLAVAKWKIVRFGLASSWAAGCGRKRRFGRVRRPSGNMRRLVGRQSAEPITAVDGPERSPLS